MSKRIFDDDSEISYKWSKRYMLDGGKGSHSKKHYNDFGQHEKKRYLNRPCSVNAFEIRPEMQCVSHCRLDCFRRLLRQLCTHLNLDGIGALAKAYRAL
jgi:hypothetical protein